MVIFHQGAVKEKQSKIEKQEQIKRKGLKIIKRERHISVNNISFG
jgi:hypothetical protein